MPVTETTTTSWFSRLKSALMRIVIGPILILVAIYFLFSNEGRSIATYRSLAEGAGLVVTIDSGRADPANDGKLVHVAGPVTSAETPTDAAFSISAPGALALVRSADMYQWIEKRESKSENKLGGGTETVTTYSYVKDWRSSRVDSASFRESGHDNPQMLVTGARFVVGQAALGAFTVPGDRLARLGDEKPLALNQDDAERMAANLATNRPVRLNQGGLYIGASATAPQIGDIRMSYQAVTLAEASMVGMQQGTTIVPYKASNGRSIMLAAAGQRDAASMFDTAQAENTFMTWLIRGLGLVGLFIGFAMMMSIIGVIADVIPAFGSIARFGTGLIAAVLTLVIGPLTIAIGWFAYRPLLSAIIIGAGVALALAVIAARRRSIPAASPAALGRPQG